jgi:isopentenyl phosphate kinase
MGKNSFPRSVVLIKLGGAVITDKSVPNTVRRDVLKRLIGEIKAAQAEIEETIVLGHGSGSFGHVPASQYGTIDGFKNEESRLGMAIVQDTAARLNRIVIRECLRQGLPAVTLAASNSLLTDNKKAKEFFTAVFREYLVQGMLPVTYGDVIVDQSIGCTIWSTDKILAFFAQKFLENDWRVTKIVHVTQVPGVYRDLSKPEQGIFESITADNAALVKQAMGVTRGFDVTGGMWHKIEESLAMARQGVETAIIAGEKPGLLHDCLTGRQFTGTRIGAA